MIVSANRRNVENLLLHGVSRALVEAIFPDINRSIIKRYIRQSAIGTPVRRSWTHAAWQEIQVEATSRAHNNAIIRWYAFFHALAALNSNNPIEVERTAAMRTIHCYRNYIDAPVYSADGVYAVIDAHRQGMSHRKHCKKCGESYWVFVHSDDCPACYPPHKRICEACGAEYLVNLGETGRPPKYCPDCRVQTSDRKQQIA